MEPALSRVRGSPARSSRWSLVIPATACRPVRASSTQCQKRGGERIRAPLYIFVATKSSLPTPAHHRSSSRPARLGFSFKPFNGIFSSKELFPKRTSPFGGFAPDRFPPSCVSPPQLEVFRRGGFPGASLDEVLHRLLEPLVARAVVVHHHASHMQAGSPVGFAPIIIHVRRSRM